ncbi:uncharacterized protein LOC128551273 [Mercenaria mercenaria]|uniref:uncharacterized protein LOC128551273 n=1 Tax=Mercenaria mercenaria TaxID=6596 RepID=UPI00234FAF07|nr:uncharacterized protein LOC128551273 [Mercenaria mercenaria]
MMVSKTFKHLLKGIHSTLNETSDKITNKLDSENTANLTNQAIYLAADNNQTSVFTTQIKTDVYQILSTTLIASEADNSTQSTMTRNIVSAFTINSADVFDKPHHNIMVAILLGIFTCISITITISIFVFCRKKNSVFMLQKCEQDSDIDLEMNDMNTEVETSDSEYEFIESTSPQHSRQRSQTCPNLSKYADVESTKEENQQLNFEKYSNSRRSFNNTGRSNHHMSGSPTSTPLLNSTSQTSLNISNGEFKRDSKFSPHSLSLNFTNASGATAAEISGRKLNQSKKQTKENKLNQSIKGKDDTKSCVKSSHQQTKPGKSKYLNTKQNSNTHKIRNSEHGFFEIKVKYSSGRTKKKHHFCVQDNDISCRNEPQVDSSILRMESIEDDNADLTDGDLHDETDDLSDVKGELEIL